MLIPLTNGVWVSAIDILKICALEVADDSGDKQFCVGVSIYGPLSHSIACKSREDAIVLANDLAEKVNKALLAEEEEEEWGEI